MRYCEINLDGLSKIFSDQTNYLLEMSESTTLRADYYLEYDSYSGLKEIISLELVFLYVNSVVVGKREIGNLNETC